MSEGDGPSDGVSVVTGAGQGIGRAVAARLAARGSHVVCVDRVADSAARTAARLRAEGGLATECTADVSVAAECEAVAEVAAGIGRVRVLCNVAGISPFATGVDRVGEDLWDRVFAVNVKSVYLMSRALLGSMRSGEDGVVVNMASVHAFAALEQSAPYAASKGAVVALTRQMAVDLAPSRIRVVAVAPGAVDTPSSYTGALGLGADATELAILKDPSHLGWLADPDDVAEVVAFLSSHAARFVNGTTVVVDGGMLAQLPRSS
ncbi:MAG: SDR family NAD(P)-dependent oxidoreductase [Actinomycetota bacterium]|nr:SDR family NAD(P)-dependent oxidoreductase [Actinomycetota bacterium]